MPDMQNNPLITGLLRPGAYDHPTETIRLVETHCAWVLLTGEFAYKVKKPVDFGFLDFSTLEKRRHYCAEEIRLNQRFAPQIYLDVVAIGGSPGEPRVGAPGPALEYAVRMRQFADDGLLSQLAARHCLQSSHIDQLIDIIGAFHQGAERAPSDSVYGDPGHVHHWVRENFEHIGRSLRSPTEIDRLEHIRQWSESERTRLTATLQARKRDGFVRECHGDLHLGNITLIDDRVTPFDCIEFNPELRWIDVISEVAFLMMDLDDRGYKPFAFRFLNGYLQFGGDYAGLQVLRYYLVYRALVRAKVAMLRRTQADRESDDFREAGDEYRQYAQLAQQYLAPAATALIITHGLSGSGKSTVARGLCEQARMIQIRSDVERKRLAGMAATDRSHSATGEGLYTQDQTTGTYRELARLAILVLQAGHPVIVDATFLQRAQREQFRDLAQTCEVPFIILDCTATDAELERRILERATAGRDPSEAGLDVLRAQREACEPLDAQELAHTLRVDTQAADLEKLHTAIDRLRRSQVKYDSRQQP
jgi:aminoglycoside phosphotransferase family enzyme/predicted kinase